MIQLQNRDTFGWCVKTSCVNLCHKRPHGTTCTAHRSHCNPVQFHRSYYCTDQTDFSLWCYRTRSPEDVTASPRTRGFRLFQSGGQNATNDTGTATLRREDPATLSRVGQRLASVPLNHPHPNAPQMDFKSSAENLLP